MTPHWNEVSNSLVTVVLKKIWRGKPLAGNSAVFLLAFLVIPNAAFAVSQLENPAQKETGPVGFHNYAGILIGPGLMKNRLLDVDGFADWGNPGTVSKYDDTGFGGGFLVGRKFDVGGLNLRMELDGVITHVSASTDKLDPEGLDETAEAGFPWIISARGGIEKVVGRQIVFATAGLAIAGIGNSVTDIDSGTIWDPDDSFSEDSTELGWVIGTGLETALSNIWALRLEVLYMDFGESVHLVNRSGNNLCCGPDTPRRPVSYEVENRFSTARLAIIRRF